ncbi:MAG: PAS domain S-box protein [Pseudomonadota bacterium]|nr:PAS domain S-box protein [Pseudomonadota bacterium]
MIQSLIEFFNSENFMPHGHCFLWQPDILWLHVISDAGIVAAYYAIPFVLLYIIRRRRDVPFQAVFWLFGAFILLCGTTHLMSIWVLWHPDYAFEGVIKAMTALASIGTFIVMIRLMPQIMKLPSPAQQAALNEKLLAANRKLEALYEQHRASGNETRALLAAIVESSDDPIISKSLDDVILSWNAAAEKLFGYKAGEIIGKPNSIIIPPDKQEDERRVLAQLRAGKRVEHYESVRVTKDGRRLDVWLTVSPIYDTTGTIIGFSKITRDITERKLIEKKLQAAHKYIEDVLNHIPDPIFMKDRQHRWIGGNKAFWEIMNGPPEKFIGKSDYEFFPREEADVFWEKDDKVLNSNEIDVNEEFFTDSRGRRHVFSTKKVAFLNEDGEKYLVGIIRDITEIKEAEMLRARYVEELKRSNQELDDFAYIASHDLKEPLRGLYNHASFLLEDYQDKLDKDGVHKLKRLAYLAQRMERLVNDLLYFSRLGRTELAVQESDPNAMVQEVSEMMESFLKDRHARIIIKKPMPNVVCDRLRITEVFRNLITNAVKYNDKDERLVEIGFLEQATAPHGMEKNVFYVRDNGLGIEPEFHQEIFRIFRRLQNPLGEQEGGTGVGLTFVKKIIERHKGRIWLESEMGKGTTFYFTVGRSV